MSPVWPDYRNSGLALISSIASYFGAPTGHPTLSLLDRICLQWKHDDYPLVGVHAGLPADEMRVPLFIHGADI